MSRNIYLIDNDALVKIFANWRNDNGSSGRATLEELARKYDIRITDQVFEEAASKPGLFVKDAAVFEFTKSGKITFVSTSVPEQVDSGKIPTKNAGEVSIIEA